MLPPHLDGVPIVFDVWADEDCIALHPCFDACVIVRDHQSLANVIDWWNETARLIRSGLRTMAHA